LLSNPIFCPALFGFRAQVPNGWIAKPPYLQGGYRFDRADLIFATDIWKPGCTSASRNMISASIAATARVRKKATKNAR
jgi:hypothetical protein